MDKTLTIKIKDSVDLFLYDDIYLTAYFMNTRVRKSFRVDGNFISLIGFIDGYATIGEICDKMRIDHNVEEKETLNIIETLLKKNIATPVTRQQDKLSLDEIFKYSRQINYFSEFLGSEYAGITAQKKLKDSNVIIFGCGAVGGNIAVQLAMAGVEKFTLYDYDVVENSDVSRHLFFKTKHLGKRKIDSLREELLRINKNICVITYSERMVPDSNVEKIIRKASFVVNTMDEPYIGYTASKISRICVLNDIPHFIAGGFDAHLASTGELIVPYKTPCVECYTDYFKEILKNWKPKDHPVKRRYLEIGGLSSMALFASSFAAIEIIKYIAGLAVDSYEYKTRGELLFGSLELTYLTVEKNPNCVICGGRKNET